MISNIKSTVCVVLKNVFSATSGGKALIPPFAFGGLGFCSQTPVCDVRNTTYVQRLSSNILETEI